MKVVLKRNGDRGVCIVTKEEGDPTFRSGGWSTAESTFLYHVKKVLQENHDVIKKRMWKDGHLVDEDQQYIRTRAKKNPSFAIWNNMYAVYDAGIEFNECGEVTLFVIWDIW